MKPEDLNKTIKETIGIEIKSDRDSLIENLKTAIADLRAKGFTNEEIKILFKDVYVMFNLPATLIMVWLDQIFAGEL